jgi:adenylate cyclase
MWAPHPKLFPMPDLIAQGPEPEQRWRRTLPEEKKVVLGRSTGNWVIPWDDRVSRRHVEIYWHNDRLQVAALPSARNPIFYHGREMESFSLSVGEHFVIGGTTFTLVDEQVNISLDVPQPTAEQSYSAQYLRRVRFRDADQRIEVLSRLPEIIGGAGTDSELFVRLVNVVLTGVPRASAAAVVAVRQDDGRRARLQVLHWDRRTLATGDFRPSERLIRQAVERSESVVHVWSGADPAASSTRVGAAFTLTEDTDWAFATPVRGDACRGWAIYVAGRAVSDDRSGPAPSDPHDLRDDVKFTELAATTLANLREMRQLERSQAGLSQFFSPVVLEALAGQDPEVVLAPRQTEVSVLFCDLRGFSRRSEQLADDLLGLLNRVSRALGVTTRNILDQGGVVGDFHGDAAMGFWGWPLAQEDAIGRACRASLGIRSEFAEAGRRNDHPLTDFRIGIGVATGQAVAGKIGTVDQVKVTVFGPVVNLASRLEGMTKFLRAPILLDERTAEHVRRSVPRELARVRRVAVVRPFGLTQPLEVSELLPPAAEYPQLSDEHIAASEEALDALLASDWARAFELLHRVPAGDRVKDFLTVLIAQHNRTPPDGWDGVIPLESK